MQKRMVDEVQRDLLKKQKIFVGTPVTSVEPSRLHTAWGYFNVVMAIAEKEKGIVLLMAYTFLTE